jgi:hypothetical protein
VPDIFPSEDCVIAYSTLGHEFQSPAGFLGSRDELLHLAMTRYAVRLMDPVD